MLDVFQLLTIPQQDQGAEQKKRTKDEKNARLLKNGRSAVLHKRFCIDKNAVLLKLRGYFRKLCLSR